MAGGLIEVTSGRMLKHRGHVGGDRVSPGIAVIAGVILHQVTEICHERRVGSHRKKQLAQDFIGERQGFFGVGLMDLGVEGQVRQAEGQLPAVAGCFDGEFSFLEFRQNFGRDFLRRIAVIGGETVEDLFVPDPVLQHLRGGFDEITRDAGA